MPHLVASQEGIGYLIKLSGGLLDTPLVVAAIMVLSIGGLAFTDSSGLRPSLDLLANGG